MYQVFGSLGAPKFGSSEALGCSYQDLICSVLLIDWKSKNTPTCDVLEVGADTKTPLWMKHAFSIEFHCEDEESSHVSQLQIDHRGYIYF